jgi:phytoene dehydrogenase-like protein
LESGEELPADAVVSAADPYTTFIRLLDKDVLPPRFRHAMENRRFHAVAMKMHLALDRLPDVAGFPAGLGPQHRGTLLIAPTLRYLEEAYEDYKAGRPSANPHIECTIPSVLDPTVAPEGKHLMGIYLQYAPYQPVGGWDEIKEGYADRVLECLEPYLPGITESVVGRCVLTPVDLERRLGLTGGDLYHGAMTGDQLFFLRPGQGAAGSHHTPVGGLYLCGSGTHPGGGVFGVPGRNGARTVLADLANLELEDPR